MQVFYKNFLSLFKLKNKIFLGLKNNKKLPMWECKCPIVSKLI